MDHLSYFVYVTYIGIYIYMLYSKKLPALEVSAVYPSTAPSFINSATKKQLLWVKTLITGNQNNT